MAMKSRPRQQRISLSCSSSDKKQLWVRSPAGQKVLADSIMQATRASAYFRGMNKVSAKLLRERITI
jgi:hypothetical protein